MDVSHLITPAVATIIGSVLTYFATRSGNKKDIVMSDRKALSEDEKAFRKELKDIIDGYKVDVEGARQEIKKLSEEVAKLHKINLNLTLENKLLQSKVDGLREELQLFRGENNK